jgi:hypothetical protein
MKRNADEQKLGRAVENLAATIVELIESRLTVAGSRTSKDEEVVAFIKIFFEPLPKPAANLMCKKVLTSGKKAPILEQIESINHLRYARNHKTNSKSD